MAIAVHPVGIVSSPLVDLEEAPRQPGEGAPPGWLVFVPEVRESLEGIAAGDRLVVLTWLHEADRGTQRVHPRDDASLPARGVFGTRSPDRPNPIGLHEVTVTKVDGLRVRVDALEAIDGTPVLDVKIVF